MANSDYDALGFEIKGIDTVHGLMTTGGDKDNYLRILDLFSKDAQSRLKIIGERLDESNISTFTTQVHALKSASASIGAFEVSRQAKALEEAGNNRDFDSIAEELDGFCAGLLSLTEDICEAVEREKSKDSAGTFPMDMDKLTELKEALRDEDVLAMDSLLEEIMKKKYGKEYSDKLSDIADDILMSEFEHALGIIEDLLQDAPGG